MSNPPAPPTIPSWKNNFLTTQTTQISRPVAPSRQWRASNDAAASAGDGTAIPEQVLADAMDDVNTILQKHYRRVYPPQASWNVAEQINALYGSMVDRTLNGQSEGDEEGELGRDADLTNAQVIQGLPPSWPSDRQATAYPMEANRYRDSVQYLSQLSEERETLLRRVERLRKIQAATAPLSSKDNIQENLVTRNGEVEKELERMRMLLVRVAGRVGQLDDRGGDGDKAAETFKLEDVMTERKRKVEQFLADGTVFPS